ncbi:glycosyltransferase family 2 protein [Bosea sp. AAP35]|uniref:glycosyltransferase n=1 Tax=Bosea sp. AAP35 TaxID=1523417 RepID=UPI0009EB4CC6|nr:glycosyltransferase family 2 protein [Bosea sp. AAP35]
MKFCVCIPAKDEEARLPVLLDALARQTIADRIAVVICLNNTTDRSRQRIEAMNTIHSTRLDLIVDECIFPPGQAHAGTARRRAMDMGAALLRPDGILITTDADARPPVDWIATTLAAFQQGADIVGGRLALDEAEELSGPLAAARALCDRYWEHVRAIEDAIDPLAWDPAPRHGDHTGGSLAMTRRLYEACGGVPLLPTGEDRALVAAAVMAGGRLRHAPEVWTRVSARRDGRAAGGMATAMSALEARGAPMLPAFAHWRQRAQWRRHHRLQFGDTDVWRAEAQLAPMPCDMDLSTLDLSQMDSSQLVASPPAPGTVGAGR